LLPILGLRKPWGTLLGEKAPSHSYACSELQHGFEPSTCLQTETSPKKFHRVKRTRLTLQAQ
jgi:hypothetical protein